MEMMRLERARRISKWRFQISNSVTGVKSRFVGHDASGSLPIILAFVLTYIAFSTSAFSQTFTASTANSTVGLSAQFQVSFTFSGQNINGLKNFTAPDFKDFMVLSGPNQSTSMQFINGAVSGSASYSYYLQPRNIGKFTIGNASIDYDGKTYRTQPLAINVVKGAPQPVARGQQTPSLNQSDIGDNVFIRATADKQRAYLGEQVTVTYRLYTRLGIGSQMQVSKLPSYEGFWAEELNESNTVNFTTETYNGKEYQVGTLKKVALFPSQTGKLSVTPLVITVPVQVRRQGQNNGDLFNQMFNNPFFNTIKTVNYTAKSNTLKVEVLPLPSANVPRSFNGAVGNYSISSVFDTTNAMTNQPMSLKIQLHGTGNIQLLNMPEINLPPGFDSYPPKTSEKIDREGMISGSKSFDYLIIPRVGGKREIPPIKFSYFNPARRNYETLSTPGYAVNIRQGPTNNNQIASGFSKEEIKTLDQGIHYIKLNTNDLSRGGTPAIFSPVFWTAVVVPLFAFVGLVTWKKRSEALAGNLELLKYRQAEKVARARFKKAKTLMDSNNQTGFYTEISLAIFGYLEDKLHIPKSEMSLERAVGELHKREIDGELVSNLKTLTEKCEFARFAPGADGASAMNEMYNDLTKVIIGIERTISSKRHA